MIDGIARRTLSPHDDHPRRALPVRRAHRYGPLEGYHGVGGASRVLLRDGRVATVTPGGAEQLDTAIARLDLEGYVLVPAPRNRTPTWTRR